jgi:hypothetical protein
MTLIGRGLLIEPVPVAATYSAHNFPLSFYRNHKGSSQHWSGGFTEPVLSTRTLAQIRKIGPAVQINIAKRQINTAG